MTARATTSTRAYDAEQAAMVACGQAVRDLAACHLDQAQVDLLAAHFGRPDPSPGGDVNELARAAIVALFEAARGLPKERRRSTVMGMLREAGVL